MFMCRWMNGDVSFVSARTKEDAMVMLDESDDGEGAEISQIRDFTVDFRLNDEGDLELAEFGESCRDAILEKAARRPDGTYRVLASRELPGRPVGHFRYYRTRPDDHILYMKADNEAGYDRILTAIDAARVAGVRRIGAITELPKAKPKE